MTNPNKSAQPSNGRALTFLALAIAGLLGQLAIFGVFLADHGIDASEFADQMFSSTIAVLALADLTVCAVVFLVWLPMEAARVRIRRWWPFALAAFGGLCFAFPLFLYFRERRWIEGATRAQHPGAPEIADLASAPLGDSG